MGSPKAGGAEMGGRCANHPQRAAIGRCPGCTRAVCAECQTRLDGILHCRDCLAARERELAEVRPSPVGRIGTMLAALSVLAAALGVWLGTVQLTALVAGRLARIAAVAVDEALVGSER